jgi:hypothetical protein
LSARAATAASGPWPIFVWIGGSFLILSLSGLILAAVGSQWMSLGRFGSIAAIASLTVGVGGSLVLGIGFGLRSRWVKSALFGGLPLIGCLSAGIGIALLGLSGGRTTEMGSTRALGELPEAESDDDDNSDLVEELAEETGVNPFQTIPEKVILVGEGPAPVSEPTETGFESFDRSPRK